ncbi:MAG: hypothetical protein HONBIEJF_01718 [Fimbriimonadaceae bacterium]|nr:hypothetical protein [Fimbriimonadaceae bacterium]
MPSAWFLLFGLLGLLTLGSVLVSFQPASNATPSVTLERARIKESILQSSLDPTARVKLDRSDFAEIASELADESLQGDRASLYLACKWLAGKEITDEDIDLMTSDAPADQALYDIVLDEAGDRGQLLALRPVLEQGSIEHQVVGAQALADLGDTSWLRQLVPTGEVVGYWVLGGLFIVALVLSPGLWLFYSLQRVSGKLKPHGGTMPFVSKAQADGLALRAFLGLIAMFLFVELVSPFGGVVPREILLAIGMLVGFVAISLLIRVPVRGHRIDVLTVIGKRDRKLQLAGWGFAGLWANLPIILVAFLITFVLRDVLPTPSHPAAETLMQDQSLPTLIGIFLAASVMAPIVEEVIFRGLILGACLRVMPPTAAILLNGFAFAAIHPQGLAGIPPLMALGVMLALITYQTGSLIPAMVMHAVNNALVLGLNVLVN